MNDLIVEATPPESGGGIVLFPGPIAGTAWERIPDEGGDLYFMNVETGETTWDIPDEVTAAEHASVSTTGGIDGSAHERAPARASATMRRSPSSGEDVKSLRDTLAGQLDEAVNALTEGREKEDEATQQMHEQLRMLHQAVVSATMDSASPIDPASLGKQLAALQNETASILQGAERRAVALQEGNAVLQRQLEEVKEERDQLRVEVLRQRAELEQARSIEQALEQLAQAEAAAAEAKAAAEKSLAATAHLHGRRQADGGATHAGQAQQGSGRRGLPQYDR